jgi:uncharacterized protein
MVMYSREKLASKFTSESKVRDAGLREFMISIYKFMTLAFLLTGAIAYTIASVDELSVALFSSPLAFIFILAPFFVAIYLGTRAHTMSLTAVRNWFWVYSALMGVSLASIFLIYTGQSIARVFLISASTFGVMAIYGYTTKRDLMNLGSFLFMGLLGIIIAGLVNLFLRSPAMEFVLSALGVLIFVGLTAYDTQRLKDLYIGHAKNAGPETMSKFAILGALTLYLDFINLFLSLLRLFGDRR